MLQALRGHCIAALLAAPLADEPRYMLALLDFAGGSPEQSQELLVQLASLRRQNAESLMQVGNAAAAGRMWSVASSVWQRAVRLSPNLAHDVLGRIAEVRELAPHEVIPSTPEALLVAARHNLRAAEPDERLISEAQRVLSLQVRQPLAFGTTGAEARAKRIAQLQTLAQIEAYRGDAAAAAELHGEIVALTPRDPPALYAHAAALAAAGDTEAAERQARKGRQLAPDDQRFDALIKQLESKK